MELRVGTAGWAIPTRYAEDFPPAGSSLARYAQRFDAAEINSSFYRSHRAATYQRWADTVGPGFRFAVKLPRAITHERRLVDSASLLEAFLAEIAPLGGTLGPLLVQLPPSFAFDPGVAEAFFSALRVRFGGPVVCEPRHPTWFEPPAESLLAGHRVGRVAADPACVPAAAAPGGWPGIVYWRLHGSPQMYRSPYAPEMLDALAPQLVAGAAAGVPVWCMFDNTTSGAALGDAMQVLRSVPASGRNCGA